MPLSLISAVLFLVPCAIESELCSAPTMPAGIVTCVRARCSNTCAVQHIDVLPVVPSCCLAVSTAAFRTASSLIYSRYMYLLAYSRYMYPGPGAAAVGSAIAVGSAVAACLRSCLASNLCCGSPTPTKVLSCIYAWHSRRPIV